MLIGLVIAGGGGKQGGKSPSARATTTHSGNGPAPAGRRHRPSPHQSQSQPQSPPSAAPVAPAGQGAGGSQASQPAIASPGSLNDRGFQLMNEGRYQDAIPLLRRAVSSAGNTNDLTYAYALYNLGRSLRLAGRPNEAIPLLERRLRIDNQRATVARELKAAMHSAHQTGGSR
jgi:tetratricopeptide (TPR) repeat protein